MSWSTGIRIEAGQDVAEALDEATLALRAERDVDTALQVQQVKDAAAALLESGALGKAPFQVTLSGHSNPGHVDTLGWANDAASISIARLTPTPPADEPSEH